MVVFHLIHCFPPALPPSHATTSTERRYRDFVCLTHRLTVVGGQAVLPFRGAVRQKYGQRKNCGNLPAFPHPPPHSPSPAIAVVVLPYVSFVEDREAFVVCDLRHLSSCSLLGVTLFLQSGKLFRNNCFTWPFFLESRGLEAASHGGGFFLNEEGRKSTVFTCAGFSQRELNRKVPALYESREISPLD